MGHYYLECHIIQNIEDCSYLLYKHNTFIYLTCFLQLLNIMNKWRIVHTAPSAIYSEAS